MAGGYGMKFSAKNEKERERKMPSCFQSKSSVGVVLSLRRGVKVKYCKRRERRMTMMTMMALVG